MTGFKKLLDVNIKWVNMAMKEKDKFCSYKFKILTNTFRKSLKTKFSHTQTNHWELNAAETRQQFD